jgi:hypothetical protein
MGVCLATVRCISMVEGHKCPSQPSRYVGGKPGKIPGPGHLAGALTPIDVVTSCTGKDPRTRSVVCDDMALRASDVYDADTEAALHDLLAKQAPRCILQKQADRSIKRPTAD